MTQSSTVRFRTSVPFLDYFDAHSVERDLSLYGHLECQDREQPVLLHASGWAALEDLQAQTEVMTPGIERPVEAPYTWMVRGAYGSVREIGDVTTDGKNFFFSQDFAPEGGPERWNIAVSDGLSDPKPYLDLQDGSWALVPSYAHSHIAWMRGINGTYEGSFDSVELWASPFTADPSQLQPQKMCDWPDKVIPHLTRSSGYGYFALGAGTTAGSYREVIWNLAAKQSREIPIPAPFNGGFGMGMTKTHVWVMGRNPKGNTSALFRFSLK